MMAKPRNSVLYLFDPLHQVPSTPRRDSSDDLGPSDKENDTPAGDVTVFFNRTFAVHKQSETFSSLPHGKLIDFGDTPGPQRLWDAAEHDGSDADGEQSESDVEGSGVLSPRAPFTDLDVEHTPRPLGSNRPLRAPVFAVATSLSQDEQPLASLLVPAPQDSPLSEVVNSINLPSMSTADSASHVVSQLPTQHPTTCPDSRPSSPFPEINVCAPETPHTADFDLVQGSECEGGPIAMTSHLRPPASLTQLAPDDPRRASVDLYSSFHMQMQSEDMSFDLLNDKVSFFGNAQDSFWAGGDDTLDFSEFNIPPAMKAKLEALVPPVDTADRVFASVFTPPAKAAPVEAISPLVSPTTQAAMNVPLPMSPTFSAPSSRNNTPPRLLQFTSDCPPSPPTSPVVAEEPSLLLESEPLPTPIAAPVAPIPALRIVKKTFKLASHQSSAVGPSSSKVSVDGGARSKKSDLVVKKRPSIAPQPAVSVPTPQSVRPPIRGVQRPPPGMHAGGNVIIGLPPQGGSSNNATSTASSTSNSSSGLSAGRAVEPTAPASRFAGIQRPNIAAKERAAPRTTTGAPRSATATASLSKATSMIGRIAKPKQDTSDSRASALRPPTRIASGTTALPKPASRLPGPFGLTRTSSMSSNSAATGTGIASRARASTLSRATGRF